MISISPDNKTKIKVIIYYSFKNLYVEVRNDYSPNENILCINQKVEKRKTQMFQIDTKQRNKHISIIIKNRIRYRGHQMKTNKTYVNKS